jgi:hypothetical protein
MREAAKTPDDLFLKLLRRFQDEGVEYMLVGGQAVRLNGFVRATEDVDVLLKPGRSNGETFESLQPYLRELEVEGVSVKLLNIEGLLKSKTDYREKDILDKSVLRKLRDQLTP